MIYTSKKRRFKDFVKSRNNKFYIAIFLLFVVVITIATITVSKKSNLNEKETETNDVLSKNEDETEDETTQLDTTGLYNIRINLSTCEINVTEFDKDSVIKRMLCSISSDLKKGEYKSDITNEIRQTWYDDNNNIYRYYTNLGNGIVFHSAVYKERGNKNSLDVSDYSKIGTITNNDGITLTLDDAKWIFEHCSSQSIVTIVEDNKEKQVIKLINIPEGITWDPTDISEGTPWSQNKLNTLEIPNKIELEYGLDINVIRSMIKATDEFNNDISSKVNILGKFDTRKAGEYQLSVQIVDIYGKILTKDFSLVIKEKETETETEEETSEEETSKKEKPTKEKTSEEETSKKEKPTKEKPTKEITSEDELTEEELTEEELTEDFSEENTVDISSKEETSSDEFPTEKPTKKSNS